MPHLFERRDWLGNSPAVWIIAVMVFCLPVSWWSLQHFRFENDVESWLPAGDSELKVLNWAERQFPAHERLVVSWESSSLCDPRIDVLRKKLEPVRDAAGVFRGGLPHIARVVGPRELLVSMQRNDVPPKEAVRRLEGVMLGAGPLRVQLTDAGRARMRRLRRELPEAAKQELGLHLKVRDAAADLASIALVPGYTAESGDVIEPSAPAVIDPDGAIQADAAFDHDLSLTWRGIGVGTPQTLKIVEWLQNYRGHHDAATLPLIERCFFVPGAPIALVVELSEAGAADRSEAIRLIRQAALDAGISEDELKLAGNALAEHELNRQASLAAWNSAAPWSKVQHRSVLLTVLLAAGSLVLLLVRNLRLSAMVLVSGIYTVFVSTAVIPLVGGTVNAILLAVPPLLLVFVLSGGIQFVHAWRNAAKSDLASATMEACRQSFGPCRLAAMTAVVGLLALCASDLAPVRSFGFYAAVGILLSFLAVIYGLPALLSLWQGQPPVAETHDSTAWRWLGNKLVRWPGVQACAVAVLCVIASYGLTRLRPEAKAIYSFGEDSRIVQDYWYLEGHLAGTVALQTIVRFDAAAQEEASFLDRMELVRAIEERLRQHPEITGCISIPDFQPVTKPPEDGASMVTKSKYHKRASLLQDQVRSHEFAGAEAFYTLARDGQDLTQPGDEGLNQPGDELWRITAQVNMMSDTNYADVLRDVHDIAQDVLRFQPGARHVVTGALPLILKTEQAVFDSLVRSALIAGGLMLLMFIVQLRSAPAGLIAAIAGGLPMTVVLGAMSFRGMRIDIGTAIAASVALGLSLPGAWQMLARFRQSVAAGQSREAATIDALESCGPANWETSWVMAVGLSVLTTAELLPLSRFGWVLASMLAGSVLSQAVFLPQLLASPVGRLFTASIPSKPTIRHEMDDRPLDAAA